jgi:hypothetical protein
MVPAHCCLCGFDGQQKHLDRGLVVSRQALIARDSALIKAIVLSGPIPASAISVSCQPIGTAPVVNNPRRVREGQALSIFIEIDSVRRLPIAIEQRRDK